MKNSLLDRAIDPISECLTPAAATKIVDLRADEEMQCRIDELADKANQGSLSDEERTEYDQYLAWFHVITILQARARRVLQNQDDS